MNQLEGFQAHRWMADTPETDNLSLFELTLPGTHNAGCDMEASYALLPGRHWLACQDVPIFAQLNRGSRALDVRLGYDASAQGLARFRFQHNGYLSSRTLEDLVREINAFYEMSRDEFIVLDFHELGTDSDHFDHPEFIQMILEHLRERIIPAQNLHMTLGELKAISTSQRIMVAGPTISFHDPYHFYRRINHQWAGHDEVSTLELRLHIAKVLASPPNNLNPWSLSATSFSLTEGPRRILGNLDSWFDPAKSDWASKCNIINFDFIKNSKIVRFCQKANIEKALYKSIQ
jgi:1-phosphatidylinositol phosphodiesterase